ncbi:MAG: haloacid dehalogenase type II [Methylococcaceae bacterium]
MPLTRRQLLKLISGTVAASFLSGPVLAQENPKIKAIAFDGFVIFDPRPIFGLAKELFPEQGGALAQLWFTKIFAYTWLRTVGGHYKSFYAVLEDALIFSAESLKLDLPLAKQQRLLSIWLNLSLWPDIKPALQQFKDNNIRLGFLSNLTEEMLLTNAKNSGIESAFEFYLSTDNVQAYKPSPVAYQMGIEAFGLPKDNIAFAAFGGWDAAGAKWFGYPTVWVNRLEAPIEQLDFTPDSMGKGIDQLVNFVLP